MRGGKVTGPHKGRAPWPGNGEAINPDWKSLEKAGA